MRIPKPCLSVHPSVPREKKLPWLRQYQSNISNWYINRKVFTCTTTWKPKNLEKTIKKVRNSNFVLWRRAESPYLRQYQSYISNWYINGKVFTSTTPWKPKNLIFFSSKISKFEFWLVTNSWNHLSFVNFSPILVVDTSMERSSRVLQHWNPKICIFSKKFEIEFWLVLKSWNHISFVNISSTLVIDTSMERSSRVLQHGSPKMWI